MHTRHPALLSSLLYLLSSLLCTHAAQKNILLIIADDYGADSSSLYNSPTTGASLPPTPNIAALAQQGVLFRNAYANPVCSPTRACILTGRHSFRTGVGDAVVGPTTAQLTAAEVTLPEALAGSGYHLANFGKWHLATGPNSPRTIGGWTNFAGILQGAIPDYTNWTKTVNGTATASYSNYVTTDIVNDSVAWIQARGAQPWLAWVAFNAGHTPLHKPPDALHSYDALSGAAGHISANPRLYFEAMIEAMDTEIGRLLAAVDRTNTHVIFIGDNGTTGTLLQPPYPSGRGKSTLYEGGTKVPFVITGPAVVNPGRTSDALVHVVDLHSTVLEMAGVAPTTNAADSRSLLPLLNNTAETAPRHVFTELFGDTILTGQDGRALRGDQFKLIRFNDDREEFYDLLADPCEGTNLLATALTATQSANWRALQMKLGEFQDTVAAPVITSRARAAGQFTVTVPRDAALAYSLWSAESLGAPAWFPHTNALVTTNGTASVTLTDTNAAATQRFYRVEARAP